MLGMGVAFLKPGPGGVEELPGTFYFPFYCGKKKKSS